jgi:hypothetical protein
MLEQQLAPPAARRQYIEEQPSNLFGTLLWYFSNKIFDRLYMFLALLLKSPILLIRFLILLIPKFTKCFGV